MDDDRDVQGLPVIQRQLHTPLAQHLARSVRVTGQPAPGAPSAPIVRQIVHSEGEPVHLSRDRHRALAGMRDRGGRAAGPRTKKCANRTPVTSLRDALCSKQGRRSIAVQRQHRIEGRRSLSQAKTLSLIAGANAVTGNGAGDGVLRRQTSRCGWGLVSPSVCLCVQIPLQDALCAASGRSWPSISTGSTWAARAISPRSLRQVLTA